MTTAWMRYRTPIKLALLPLSFGWAIANRRGLLPEPPIGSSPYLGPTALAAWREAISRSSVYLEYGAGGSSVEAVQSVPVVVSVETDARYLAAVTRRVAKAARGSFHPVHVDIGLTSKWGQPVGWWRTKGRLERWRRYPAAPWAVLEKQRVLPDFIFVDGRFRAASVLESFLRLPDGAECRFMLDDFEARKASYSAVLEFAEDVTPLDHSLAFRRKRDFDRERCRAVLEACYADPL